MELLPVRRNNQDVFAEVAEFVMDCYLARSERIRAAGANLASATTTVSRLDSSNLK